MKNGDNKEAIPTPTPAVLCGENSLGILGSPLGKDTSDVPLGVIGLVNNFLAYGAKNLPAAGIPLNKAPANNLIGS